MPTIGKAALAALLLGVAGAAIAAERSAATAHAPAAPRMDEAAVLELDLAFYRARIARDSFAARDHAELARLYLQRARGSGAAQADLVRAETHARRSLALRTGRNQEAFQVLAASLMGQHRFAEARGVAEELVAMDPAALPARATLGEIQLELGDYGHARRTFGMLFLTRADLAVAPRYARWEEIRGRPLEARRLLRAARDAAAGRHGMPGAQLGWFEWRLGDLALRQGRLDEAERELRAGLSLLPEDPRALDGLARVAASRGRWSEAIALGERAILRGLEPSTLGLLVLSYEAVGDTARGAEYERAMSVALAGQSTQLHRQWSLFLLDRGREVPAVLASARKDIVTRHDVYGWDLLAWALHRSGRDAEARGPMVRALAMGTRDAMLFFHAGMIEAALNRPDLARRHLQAALAINPGWHPLQPAEARATLARLSTAER